MARANNLIPNFTGGEISPRTAARRDVEGFYNSTEYQANFISDLQGGARFRPGTVAATEIIGERVIPFIYDELDTYFIELGNYVRVLLPTGQPKIKAPTASNTWIVEQVERRTDQLVYHVSASSYTNLTLTQIYTFTDVSFDLHESFHRYAGGVIAITDLVAVNTSTINGAWRELVVNAPGVVAAAAVTPTNPMTLAATEAFNVGYSSDEVNRLQFIQKFDSMWMTVGTKPAKQLVRTIIAGPEISFTFGDANIIRKQPGATVTATLSATSGSSVTCTASAATFQAGDIGGVVVFGAGRGLITGFTSSTVVTINVSTTFSSTSLTAGNWRVLDGDLMGGASGTDTSKFPYCVTLYEERLWYAHTSEAPSRLWGSLTGRFADFPPQSSPVLDTDTVRLTLAERSDDIIFMLADKDILYLGTLGGAVSVSSGSPSVPINANSARGRYLHNVGTAFGRPYFQFESDLYFVDRAGTGLWKVQYNYNTEKFVPEMVTIAADHLTRSYDGIKRMAVKTGDDGRIYLVTNSGVVLILTYSAPYGVRAFSRMISGGGAIRDVCVLPTASVQDQVVFIYNDGSRSVLAGQPSETSNVILQDEDFFYLGQSRSQVKSNRENWLYAKGLATYFDVSNTFSNSIFATLTLSAVSGTGVTATASAPAFSPTDVGRTITRIITAGSFGVAEIVGYTSSTVVTVNVLQEFSSLTAPVLQWWISLAAGTQITLPSFYYRNKTVSVMVDGVVYDDVPVDGQRYLDLPAEGSNFTIGFKYKGLLKTVNMLGVGSLGTSEHLKKNIAYMGVNFFETGQGTSYGTDMFNLEPLDFAQLDDPTDRPPPLFTGEKRVRFEENWEKEKHIYIKHDGGTPCTVLSLIPFFNTSSD